MPGSQLRQSDAETEAVKGLAVPAEQLVQAACAGNGLYVPAKQSMQADADVEPVLGLKVPARQSVQAAWAGVGL